MSSAEQDSNDEEIEVNGTCKKLIVNVIRENLYKLQKEFIENPCNTTKKRKPLKLCFKRAMFPCKMCSFTSKARCDLLIHIVDSHKKLAAKNKLPPAQCITRGDRLGDVYYKCVQCLYGTKRIGDFNRHLFSHKSLQDVEETFTCTKCSYECKRKDTLARHMHTHSRMVYKCPHCDYQTKVQMFLKIHINKVHRIEELEILKCFNCSFQTKLKKSLIRHMLIHNNNARKLYKCPLCPFQSYLLETVNGRHQLIHKSEEETRIYKCDVCQFKAKTKGDLKKHTLVHKRPDEVPMFKCSVCSFQTKYRQCLKRHLQNHQVPAEGKGHQCNFCDYKATQKGNLVIHMSRKHKKKQKKSVTTSPYILRKRKGKVVV